MPDKKFLEKQHYDRKALDRPYNTGSDAGNTNLADEALYAAHRYFDQVVKVVISTKQQGLILDYGCGTGSRTMSYASDQWLLTGIDISPESIKIAQKTAQQKGIRADYKIMDCENMQFEDSRFDLVIDYGTFSSLDIKKAIIEINRILKKTGTLIAIETLGHNPLFNLKRKLNVLLKKRTEWAVEHIMKIPDWEYLQSFFEHTEIKYFALFTPYTVPLLKITKGTYRTFISENAAKLDDNLLKNKFLQKWAFKAVAVMTNPLK